MSACTGTFARKNVHLFELTDNSDNCILVKNLLAVASSRATEELGSAAHLFVPSLSSKGAGGASSAQHFPFNMFQECKCFSFKP